MTTTKLSRPKLVNVVCFVTCNNQLLLLKKKRWGLVTLNFELIPDSDLFSLSLEKLQRKPGIISSNLSQFDHSDFFTETKGKNTNLIVWVDVTYQPQVRKSHRWCKPEEALFKVSPEQQSFIKSFFGLEKQNPRLK